MDATKFSKTSPGRLVTIPTIWGKSPAFVPAPLPPSWEFSTNLWPLLAQAKQQIGILEGVGSTLPNPGILLRTMTDRESIQSSRLEGTYASPRELLLFELHPRESRSRNDPINDHREVFNYRRAINHGLKTDLPLSLRLIRELHEVLLDSVRGKEKNPGEFRKIPVGIGADGRFIPPPHGDLPLCLDAFEKYLNKTDSPFDPLVDCFLLHYQFETIHPFHDGNGRVGRVLLALTLQQRCNLTKAWLYMSEYFEGKRDEYFQRLFDVSAKADWEGWIRFCLKGVVIQAADTTARCRRLLAIWNDYRKRLAEMGEGSVRLGGIVDQIFATPFVRVADLQRQMGVSYPTAKQDVSRLEQAGILRELPQVYPKTFYAPDVYQVAYEKLDNETNRD